MGLQDVGSLWGLSVPAAVMHGGKGSRCAWMGVLGDKTANSFLSSTDFNHGFSF